MSVKQLNPPNPLFFNGIPTKIKWKIHPLFTSQVLKVLLTKNCKIIHQIFYFLLFYISFYISRHHFSQIFRTFFNIIWKMIFVMNFPFLINSIKPPTLHPLNGQHWLKVTKVLCWCPFGKYEDFLELSIKQFVIQSSPISFGQTMMYCVTNQKLMLLVAKLARYFCIEEEIFRFKRNPVLFKR